jgi:hypothetical protein
VVIPRVIEISTSGGAKVHAAPVVGAQRVIPPSTGIGRMSQRELVLQSLFRCPGRRAAAGKR